MTNEFVRIMIELWTGPAWSFDGTYYRFAGVELEASDRPSAPRPDLGGRQLAGRVEARRRVRGRVDAARLHRGQRVVPGVPRGGTRGQVASYEWDHPQQLAAGIALVQELAADAGRDLSALRVVVAPNKLTNADRATPRVRRGRCDRLRLQRSEDRRRPPVSIDGYAAEVMSTL